MKLRELRIDGYKNLVDCTIPIADFNVVVGPNNSGKSNLLEVFQLLWGLCFGAEHERMWLLMGIDLARAGFHPPARPHLAIGVSFEARVNGEIWVVDFDMKVRRSVPRAKDEQPGGFESETLKAKQPSKTGPAATYVRREGKTLTVGGKDYPISIATSAISAVPILFPEPGVLPEELSVFLSNIHSIARTSTFAFSPEALRNNLAKEIVTSDYRVSSFGLMALMDDLFKHKDKGSLFTETVCDILELDALHFQASDVPMEKAKVGQPAASQRARFCLIRRKGGDYSNLAEYSDGTLMVIALVAGLILQNKTTGLTCIEELENCLHPRAQEKLLKFLKDNSNQWQLIVTTHSPYLLNGVDPADVLVAQVDEHAGTHFVKPEDRKAINELLKKGHMSFGDLMVNNFRDVVKA
jgi:energy-coupling factor transporter ATP-binding protein EcfA2